jgi:2-methylcitrate dehydratase PrpD
MAEQSVSVTRSLIDACRAVTFDAVPADAVFVAKQCVLDWLGVTIAGSREPLARILREQALDEGGKPRATLIGIGERVTTAQAALVNGGTSHALDYDDVLTDMSGHPSVPVIPALLALGEELGVSGREAIAALVAAFEMEARVGALVMPGHYAKGFHATGTVHVRGGDGVRAPPAARGGAMGTRARHRWRAGFGA